METGFGFKGICFGFGDEGRSCTVNPRGSALEVTADGALLANLSYLSCTVTLAGTDDRYLSFESSAGEKNIQVLVPDKTIIEQIEAIGAPRAFVAQLREATAREIKRKVLRKGVFVGLAAAIAALALVAWIGFQWAQAKVVASIPVDWELQMGRSGASGILQQTPVCSDGELKKAVQEIGMRLVRGVGASPYAFRIFILDNPEVNAFALPGGYVFVNRGLVEKAADGAEVAGVLAHEIQHVLLRHGLGNMVRQAGLMLLLGAVVGDAGALEQFLTFRAADMVAMSFSRDQERAADEGGLALMRNSDLDVSGLPRFLSTLAGEEGSGSEMLTLISSHPASTERVNRLEELIRIQPQAQPTPLVANWSAIKNQCSPVKISDPDTP